MAGSIHGLGKRVRELNRSLGAIGWCLLAFFGLAAGLAPWISPYVPIRWMARDGRAVPPNML